MRFAVTLLVLVLQLLCKNAFAQEGVLQPADHAKRAAQTQATPSTAEDSHQRSWEADPIVVTGDTLREEERIGSYGQPRWTVPRRFPSVRIYVVPAGTVQLDWTLDSYLVLDDLDSRRMRSKYEFEFGLGHRLQLDFFLQTQQVGTGEGSPLAIRRENLELRWAIADWGTIWGNPALYASWGRRHELPDVLELKLLLGDELTPRWHWGINLVWEHELSGTLENGYLLIAGLSYTVFDQLFSVGAELRAEVEDERGERFEFEEGEVALGPSVQWRPQPALHIDLSVLLGLAKSESESHALLWPWLVVGWEF